MREVRGMKHASADVSLTFTRSRNSPSRVVA